MSSYTELSDNQLLALPTHRLYTIYKLYRTSYLHHSTYYDDWRDGSDRNDYTIETARRHDLIKVELDKRGHIPRKHNPEGANVETPYRSKYGYGFWYTAPEPAKEVHGSIVNYEDAIGLQVYKKSKKPFKSKNLYNTVKSVTVNPHTGREAFDFEEDSSIVDAHLCHLRKVKK